MLVQTAREVEEGDAIAEATIAHLDGQIAVLEAETRAAVSANPVQVEQFRILTSIPGVGLVTAATLTCRMPELGDSVPRQAAALVGVAPFAVDSGQSRDVRHTHGGRRRPRNVLFTAATSASRHNRALEARFRSAEGRRQRARIRYRRGHARARDPRLRTRSEAAPMDPRCSEPGMSEGESEELANEAVAGNMKRTIGMVGCGETSDLRQTCGTGPAQVDIQASNSPRRLPSGRECSTRPPPCPKRRGRFTSNMSFPDVVVVTPICSSRTRQPGLGSPVSGTGRLGPTRSTRNWVRPSRRPR